jgi:hypothetical protein
MAMRLMVMDANQPWVQSLFSAMPSRVVVEWFRPTSLSTVLRRGVKSFLSERRKAQENILEHRFTYPGWRRFPEWSARVAANRLRRALGESESATIVYTLPFYNDVAARVTDAPAVYFAYDPYGSYEGWDAGDVARRERELMQHCRAVFAISPALAEDFKLHTDLPVYVQPNGISLERIAACLGRPARPADLREGSKTACCVGQIGTAYDWPLLLEVTSRCRDISFIFVGPRHRMSGDGQLIAEKVFAQSNVMWLGLKRPDELPAYLAHCDVLFSPLALTPANHRRSLLRIYDYLATDRHIVATPVASAVEHEQFLMLAATAHEFAESLRAAAVRPRVDPSPRISYLQRHTWEHRANMFLENLSTTLGAAGVSGCAAKSVKT